MICPVCSKKIDFAIQSFAFCPWCGAALESEENELFGLIATVQKQEDPVKKYEILAKAKRLYPDSLEVETELLCLGRMYEHGGKPDFYRIPYWALNALEKPGEFTKKQRKQMLQSFFNNPEVERVSMLSGDPMAFKSAYYRRMAAEYMNLFVKQSASNNSFLFFRRSEQSRNERYNESLGRMLLSLKKSKDVPEEIKPVFEEALIEGFADAFGQR